MADTEMKYFAKLGLDSSDFMGGLSKSQQGMLAFARDVTVTMTMTIMLFDRVISSVERLGQAANDLRDLSYTTGIATEQLQRFHYAAILSGTSIYAVDSSLQKLTLSMDEATDATSTAGKAFARLGVDPNGKTPAEVFEETTRALSNMKYETERNSIAMDIYGRSWKELIPFMDTYLTKSEEIAAAPVYSDEEIRDLAEAKVAWDKLTNSITIYSGKALAAYQETLDKTKATALISLPMALILSRFLPGEAGKEQAAGTPESKVLPGEVAVEHLTDKFEELNDQEIELVQTADDLRQAIKDQAKALDSGNKEAFDKASARVATLTNRYYELAAAMMAAQAASGSSNAAIGGWDPLSVVGTEGSNMQLFLAREMNLGISYEQALKNWAHDTPTSTAGTLSAIGNKSVIININNPKGTPSEIAAATKAGMRQSGTALSVGGAS